MSTTDPRAHSFDPAAALYDEVRPGYPDSIFKFLVAHVPAPAQVLEVGAGTGQATLPLVRRGYAVTAVEPGPAMAAVLRDKLTGTSARVVNATFETAQLHRDRFALAVTAMSFHWLDHPVALPKLHRLLQPNGHLAILGNGGVWHPAGADFHEAVQPIYQAHTQHLAGRAPTIDDLPDEEPALTDSDLFVHVATRRVLQLTRYTTERYLKLLETFSDHRALPPERQAAVRAGVAAVIESLGGEMVRPIGSIARLYRIRLKSIPAYQLA